VSANILEHFASLEEPRVEGNKRHALLDSVLLAVCAVTSGADGWEAIEDFGQEKLDWLRKLTRFENAVPSHDCIANVVSGLTPKGFQECFLSWTQAVAMATADEVIAVDGKTACGSQDRRRAPRALHMLSAWASSNPLVLGQEATEEKSNEITAIPNLLELLGLKGNQSTLQESVEDFFSMALAGGLVGVAHDYTEELDTDHGRLELRRYWVTEDLCTLPNTQQWAGLRSIGMVERDCRSGETHTVERRYFINSIRAEATRFAMAVRGHWGVENRLCWRLDVVFGEDARRIRKANAPAIMTSIRHLCMNLFEQELSSLRLSQKRRKAAWNDGYRAKVVFSG